MNHAVPLLVGLTIGAGAVGGGWAWRTYRVEPAPLPPPTIELHRTVSWFMVHPDERRTALVQCHDDPGHTDPDCVNAEQAKLKADAEAYLAKAREAFK
jgi:hypothetical protein